MRLLVAFVALMLYATVAVAQTTPDKRELDTPLIVYAATAGADWAVASVCFECAQQTGLLLRGVENPKKAVPLGLAIDAGLALGIRQWVFPHHPKLAKGLIWGLVVTRVVLLTHRISDLRRNGTRQETP